VGFGVSVVETSVPSVVFLLLVFFPEVDFFFAGVSDLDVVDFVDFVDFDFVDFLDFVDFVFLVPDEDFFFLSSFL